MNVVKMMSSKTSYSRIFTVTLCFYSLCFSLSSAAFVGSPTSFEVVKYAEGNYWIPKSTQSAKFASPADISFSGALSKITANERVPRGALNRHKTTATSSAGKGSFLSELKAKSVVGGSEATPFAKVAAAAASQDYLQRFPGISHYESRTSGTGYYNGTQFNNEPPDCGFAVGSGFVVQAVNSAIRVYSAANGAPLVATTPNNQFFNMTYPIHRDTNYTGDTLSDPRVLYDPIVNRWFVFIWGRRGSNSHRLPPPTFQLIAVSYSKNPLSGFRYFYYNTALTGSGLHSGCPCIPDYQMVGVDAYGVHITANAYGGNFVGAQFYVLSKKQLVRGTKKFFAQMFDGLASTGGFVLQGGEQASSIQPAKFPSSSAPALGQGGTQYFLSTFDNSEDNRVEVWAMTNTESVNIATLKLALQQVTLRLSFTYAVPLSGGATQKSGSTPLTTANKAALETLDLGDCRMQQVIYSNGHLFGAFTTRIFDSSLGVYTSGIAWVIIKPSFSSSGTLSARLVASGVIAISGFYAFFPAITVNARRAVIVFALSGRTIYPSLAYVYIPFSTYKPGVVRYAWQGMGPEDGFSGLPALGGDGVARWGDYFAATTDERGRLWITGQTIVGGPRVPLANWGMYIAQLPVI
eukprot:TRINITY_DN16564_c0_g1_i1.p1 TRINITY_DN16564_c0_g1~~TRINITY_DN16564_c0_g1_i1.p1  ORF type:complete len:634 (+),score=19.99 TRINITY_DN16564_c0_g1_i1:411-2312(+)